MDTQQNLNSHYDVCIIGAGFIGLTLAKILSQHDLSILVIDKQDLSLTTKKEYDGRTLALSYATKTLYEQIGLWGQISSYAEPIKKILVQDSDLGQKPSPLSLFFDFEDQQDSTKAMGYIVENDLFRKTLIEEASKESSIHILQKTAVKDLQTDSFQASITLDDDQKFTANLLVGADGRFSFSRQLMNIAVDKEKYNQSAIVTVVHHEKPHNQYAYENFMPAGPFAILPMTSKDGVHRSSIVWTDETEKVNHFIKLDHDRFSQQIKLRFGEILGDIKTIQQRWAYPLQLSQAETYIKDRFCLIGDAAHAIHPIAGQGFNLGIRDVASLAELIVNQNRIGLDIGNQAVLSEYAVWRKRDCQLMIFMTDFLNKFFSNHSFLLKKVRRIGLGIVNQIPPAKKFFMNYAMGFVGISTNGRLPKLLRGKKL